MKLLIIQRNKLLNFQNNFSDLVVTTNFGLICILSYFSNMIVYTFIFVWEEVGWSLLVNVTVCINMYYYIYIQLRQKNILVYSCIMVGFINSFRNIYHQIYLFVHLYSTYYSIYNLSK